jgi:hypothetical protein
MLCPSGGNPSFDLAQYPSTNEVLTNYCCFEDLHVQPVNSDAEDGWGKKGNNAVFI